MLSADHFRRAARALFDSVEVSAGAHTFTPAIYACLYGFFPLNEGSNPC